MEYKFLRTIGEESPGHNDAIQRLIDEVNQHHSEGWTPFGGISVSAIAGPMTKGSERVNWFTRFAQALTRQEP